MRINGFQIFFKSFTSVINTNTHTMADVSLDDLIKQDKDKNKAQRSTNVFAILSRKPSKRKSYTNKEIKMNLNKAATDHNNSPTNPTSKINNTTNLSFRAENSNKLRTLRDQPNSNRINLEKSLKEKTQNRKINCSEP